MGRCLGRRNQIRRTRRRVPLLSALAGGLGTFGGCERFNNSRRYALAQRSLGRRLSPHPARQTGGIESGAVNSAPRTIPQAAPVPIAAPRPDPVRRHVLFRLRLGSCLSNCPRPAVQPVLAHVVDRPHSIVSVGSLPAGVDKGRPLNVTPSAIALGVIFAIVAFGSAIGFYAGARRKMDLEQWTVAGRGFGVLLMWLLMAGEVYTTFSFLGASGWAYSRGAPTLYILAYITLANVVAFFTLPPIWELGRAHKLQTQSDFFEWRYKSRYLAAF